MLLRGVAGIGKTHAIVDHALHRFRKGQVGFVFFGEDFSHQEPWQAITAKLGFGADVNRDELWDMIDTAGEASGRPALVYIDGLNKSTERTRWRQSWLGGLRKQLARCPNIKLCVSCRDTFLEEVIDSRAVWPEFVHNGFAGKEFEAIREFFDFYGLKSPAIPLLQPEFANPLFLHLICDGLVGANLDSLPLGSTGFTEVLRLLLIEKNKAIAKTCRYDPVNQKVAEALLILARMMADTGTRRLKYRAARDAVNALHLVDDHTRSLFYNLEKEGLIAFVELRSQPLGPPEHFCRFTFERVGDFLIADELLSRLEPETLPMEFAHGRLAFLVETIEAANEHRGLLEALSIIIPEHSQGKLELADVVHDLDRHRFILPIIFSGFQWRAKQAFTRRTVDLVKEGLSSSQCASEAMDAILGVALIPFHLCNANLLDSLLSSSRMASRDAFWSYTLYDNYETRRNGWRLIEWALKADLSGYFEEVFHLWSIVLSWFCAAADRRIRDRSTKGLVRLFLSCPQIIPSTLS